jgi:hypothetical protein
VPDLADLAQAFSEPLERFTLAARCPAAPAATGHCLNCGEPLPAGRRWCDTDCRDDWQAMDDRRQEAA